MPETTSSNTASIRKVSDYYGCNVFSDNIMRDKLPESIYQEFRRIVDEGRPLTINIAEFIANAMREWAIEKGATHYTHWFQPMTGITAEKHDAFICPNDNGTTILEFTGKELIKGEPDASSFPSGGLRATFEARGYTAWDPTSYAFVKEHSLYIPTAFCSYSGEALDKKTPLLRSMQAINKQALRVLKLFGNTAATKVVTTVGGEQEYFLIDKTLYDKRPDLQFTGRTLFGAAPPKGQELEDHYFGNLKDRISSYMSDLDTTLWELGIAAKTKHNEAAPAQHELAPVFTSSNIAADHNQLIMEIMKKVALRHGLVCLLHEKPFAGVNGSGKHNNWSLYSNDGQNLFDPGDSPMENAQFLTFVCAVIKAVDDYPDLLRVSVSSAGNDHRLGANEAPPAIVSIFLGSELTSIIEAIETDTKIEVCHGIPFDLGATCLPNFPKDTTDRNRTSPFAFTGNKFEFRMVGSAASISGPNIVLNSIVAETLSQFADKLEKAENFKFELKQLLQQTIKNHKRIIFNGNNYCEEWVAEAQRRGLPNLMSAVDALPTFTAAKNVKMFIHHGVFNAIEVNSRCEIMLENYSKCINIEALTTLDIAKRMILPSSIEYTKFICDTLISKKALGITDCVEEGLAKKLSSLTSLLDERISELESIVLIAKETDGVVETAQVFQSRVFPVMQGLRAVADELEKIVAAKYWPMPTYADLMFKI